MFQSIVDAISGSAWSYGIIFGVAALDAFFPVVPSEATVIAAGVLAAQRRPPTRVLIIAAAAPERSAATTSRTGSGRIFGERIAEQASSPATRRQHLDRAHRLLEERGGYLIVDRPLHPRRPHGRRRSPPGASTGRGAASSSSTSSPGSIWALLRGAARVLRRQDLRGRALEGAARRVRGRAARSPARSSSCAGTASARRQLPAALHRVARVRIGVPKETAAGERRVALVPEVVAKLVEAGHEVVVERGAGSAASFEDAGYEEAGAHARRPRLGRGRGRQGAEADRRGGRAAAAAAPS